MADLLGHTEEDLLRIEGIGVKAIEELKEGLAARDLMARSSRTTWRLPPTT